MSHVSLRARPLVRYYQLIREKRTWSDLGELDKEIRDSQRPRNASPPNWMRRRYTVEEIEVSGFPCYTISPKGEVSDRLRLMHLHGGGYVQQISPHHWRFLRHLVDQLRCPVVVPLYPLAPGHHSGDTLPMVRAAYERTMEGIEPERHVLMGDSAGGGLCVALDRQLRGEGLPQPGRLVLISPWLDLTMTDPSVATQDRRDPYLGARGLAAAGRWYGGPAGVRDPCVSPLFGDLHGLPPSTVYVGTRDVLLGDARRFRDSARRAGVDVEYHESPGMVHNWPMRRLPEGRRARDQIIGALRADGSPRSSRRGSTPGEG